MVKSLGECIRELRDRADLSLRELAEKVDVSAAFLSDIELGRRHPSEKVLSDIAKNLDVPLAELRKHDTRSAVRVMKRLASTDPILGLAFRTVLDNNIKPEELLKWAEERGEQEKKRTKRSR